MGFFLFILKQQKFASVIAVFQHTVHIDSVYKSDRPFKYCLIQEGRMVLWGAGKEWRNFVCYVSLLQELFLLDQPSSKEAR